MPYTVTSFDGDFTIDALTIDTSNTALSLPGKNYSGWGQAEANNFTHLLENFALGEPGKKRTGQLWYDTDTRTLKIWDSRDNNWARVGSHSDTADRLANARTISLTGDATGSFTFDGTSNTSVTVTLAPVLGNPGFFSSPAITVDATGRITAIDNTGGDGVGPAQYVTAFNGRSSNVALTYADVINALGFTPTANALTSLTYANIVGALGFTPVNKAGDTMTGQLDMGYFPISHAGNITTYGNLRMGTPGMQTDFASNRLQNVGAPVVSTDGATKGYVDSKIGGGGGGGNVTVSPNPPSGGGNGDVWYRY